MAYTTSFLLPVFLTGLITASNFLAIFIALIVVFFLLGMVFGVSINTNKKVRKLAKEPVIENNNKKQSPADALKQDNQQNTGNQSKYPNPQFDQLIPGSQIRQNTQNTIANQGKQRDPANQYNQYTQNIQNDQVTQNNQINQEKSDPQPRSTRNRYYNNYW